MTTCATREPASPWTSSSPRLPKTWASKSGRFSSCPTARGTAASKWGHTAATRCASASISGTGFKLNVEATFNISTPAKTSKCVLHKRHGNAIVSPRSHDRSHLQLRRDAAPGFSSARHRRGAQAGLLGLAPITCFTRTRPWCSLCKNMKVSLNPELERFVEEKVRAGQYQSADEVVNSAVAMLRQQETLSAEDIAELRREIAIGLEQLDRGESAPWDAAALKNKLRRRAGSY